MKCRPLLPTGKTCLDTTDCQMDHICWPLTPADAAATLFTCNEVFSRAEGTIIGMRYDKTRTALENSLNAGMFCESGIAKVFNNTHAMCVKVAQVVTDINGYKKNDKSTTDGPFYCDLNQQYNSTPQGCRYQYRNVLKNGSVTYETIAEEYCECSLNAELNANGTGVCPMPGQGPLQKYVDVFKFALQNSNCHSDEWMDWLAQKECGIGSDPATYSKWVELVESSFDITYYPFIQAGGNRQCLQEVMYQSLTNLLKQAGVFGRALSLVVLTTLSISLLAI